MLLIIINSLLITDPFSGRQNENSMHEFIDECYLQVLSHVVNKEKDVFHRMGALFALYCLYVKQPLDESYGQRLDFKIRITLDQLIAIRELVNECKANRYIDVCYVWYKLVSIGVHFVHYRYEGIGPSNTRSCHYWMFENTNSSTDKAVNDLQQSIDTRLKDCQDLHVLYVDYKDKVFQPNRDLKPNIITHDLFSDSTNNLLKLVMDFRFNNRDFRGRGRPSVWTALRTDANNHNNGINCINGINAQNVGSEEKKIIVKKKAIKSKVNVDQDQSSDILWTQDLKDKFKKEKQRMGHKKTHKSKKNNK